MRTAAGAVQLAAEVDRAEIAADHHDLAFVAITLVDAAGTVHPHADRSVTVRVEKLELGPGSVGVEITRQRQSEVADVYQLYPTAAGKARLAGSD